MGKPKGKRARPMDPEDRYFAVYRELREELRQAPELPPGFNAVVEMAKLSQEENIGPALKFLCLKEVASYTHPRMESATPSLERRPLQPGAVVGPGAVTRFLPGGPQ